MGERIWSYGGKSALRGFYRNNPPHAAAQNLVILGQTV